MKHTNKKRLVSLCTLGLLLALLLIPHCVESKVPTDTTSATMEIVTEPIKPIEPLKLKPRAQIKTYKLESDVEEKLAEYFSTSTARIALAILKHESGLNLRATGYNCWYDANGTAHETKGAGMKSKPCKKADRPLTFGVDCGIVQIHFRGNKQCPEYAYEIDWSIKRMAEMYKTRGFKPWVSYTSGAYKPFLD